MKGPPAESDVAAYMEAELRTKRFLYQDDIVYAIHRQFGEDFTYINENGNLAISKKVLQEFRRLTGNSVVWERGERMWRFREDYDPIGKRGVE